MVTKLVPSLSMNGWIDDPKKQLDFLFSYYILTDYAQSYLFQNNLQCLSNIYYKYINDPDNFAINLKTDFTSYLEKYFPIVEVKTLVKKIESTQESYIVLNASVIDDKGVRHDLTEITQINSSNSRKVIRVNNYGSAIEYLNNI